MMVNIPVDLLTIIRELREDRMAMIQTSEQYKYAWAVSVELGRRAVQGTAGADLPRPSAVVCVASKDSDASTGLRADPHWELHASSDTVNVFSLVIGAPAVPPRGPRTLTVPASATPTSSTPASSTPSTPVPPPRALAVPASDARASALDTTAVASSPADVTPVTSVSSTPSTQPQSSPEIRRKLSVKPLKLQTWFRTGQSRMQVDELLHSAPEGMFIVRESTQTGCYALSVVHSGAVVHMLIIPVIKNTTPMFKLGSDGDLFFPTVAALVEYYTTHPYAHNDTTGEDFQLINSTASRRVSSQSFV